MKKEIIGNEFLVLKPFQKGGTSTIYLVEKIKTGKTYVAKIYNDDKDFENEVNILKHLSSLNNPNIIKLISYSDEQIEKIDDPIKENKKYVILDYFPNKDLFNYIKTLNGLSEQETKKMFYQIVKAVQQCHNNGIYHGDLKPENILLNENYEPVLCDFGYGCIMEEENGEKKKLNKYEGTTNYCSPEIWKNIPYDGEKSDIFSLGVILFTLYFGSFGFVKSTPNDGLYKLIMKKKYIDYWNKIGNLFGMTKLNVVSPEYKNLYLKLVAKNPNDRPTIEEILNHEWFMNG